MWPFAFGNPEEAPGFRERISYLTTLSGRFCGLKPEALTEERCMLSFAHKSGFAGGYNISQSSARCTTAFLPYCWRLVASSRFPGEARNRKELAPIRLANAAGAAELIRLGNVAAQLALRAQPRRKAYRSRSGKTKGVGNSV